LIREKDRGNQKLFKMATKNMEINQIGLGGGKLGNHGYV